MSNDRVIGHIIVYERPTECLCDLIAHGNPQNGHQWAELHLIKGCPAHDERIVGGTATSDAMRRIAQLEADVENLQGIIRNSNIQDMR